MATATATKPKTSTKKRTNITPIDDRVVVKPTEAPEKTESGIFLPEAAQEKPQTGDVIAVGPGKLQDDGTRTKPSVKTGDTVLFGKYGGTNVELDGEDHMILRESDLLGVLE